MVEYQAHKHNNSKWLKHICSWSQLVQ